MASASGGKEYQLAIKIAGKLDSSFNAAVSSASASMKALGAVGSAIGTSVKVTAKAFTATATAVAAVGVASVKAGAEFDTAMSQVAATMGKTMADMQNEVGTVDLAWGTFSGNLREYALEMGKNTAFSATQAAEALNYMALAGYDTQTSMEMLPNVLNLAAAGSMELATASDMVTDTQTAFGISLDRTSQMVDEMAKAASTGNTSVQQLGEAFLTVGGLAKELNGGVVTLKDGTTASVDGVQELEIALTAMANAGIKGQEAGTHMRNMLLKLSSPTDNGVAAFESLGVSVFDAEGKMRSLSGVFGDLSTSMGKLTQEEKLQAISNIFNTRDTASAEALLHAVSKDWDEIGESILNAEGAAQKMADVQLDNLAGDVTLFKSALEGAEVAVDDQMTPALRQFVQFGTTQMDILSDAVSEGGITGLADAVGDVIVNTIMMLGDAAPDFLDVVELVMNSMLDSIENNSDEIGNKAADILVKFGTAILKLTPRLWVVGAKVLVALAKGLIENYPVIKQAAIDAISYLMTEAKAALKKYADFLGDDEVEPFKKILSLIPAVAAAFAGFSVVGGIVKKVKSLITTLKGIGKASSTVTKGMGSVNSTMSSTAKNILGAGVGFAAAAAGIWLLADAAIRIDEAGPGAAIALTLMTGGIIAMMAVAANMASKLQAGTQGLIAFGGAVLMTAAGFAIMSYAAVQLANAGGAAIGTFALMEGGMIALMAVTGVFGTQLGAAAPGLLAFGAAVLMVAAGFGVMAYAAVQLSQAGGTTIAVFAGMAVGLAAFMAVAALLGPMLTAAAPGLIALGAGLLLAAAGMAILTASAIALANAGTPAIAIMAALAVSIIAFGAAAGALAPLLLAGAAALAALGAAFAIVSAAALLGSASIAIITACLPQLAEYGASGALALVTLGTAMAAFAGGAALAGAGAVTAAAGFGALAIAAAAASLAFAPLAIEMVAVSGAVAIIAASASTAADGLKSMKDSTGGMVISMTKLAAGFLPVTVSIVPFAAAVAAADIAVAAFAISLAASDAALALMATAVVAVTAGLTTSTAALTLFRTQISMLRTSATTASAAFTKIATASAPLAAALLTLTAPMTVVASSAAILATSLSVSSVSMAALVASTTAATGSMVALTATMTVLPMTAQTTMAQISATTKSGMTATVTVIQSSFTKINTTASGQMTITLRTITITLTMIRGQFASNYQGILTNTRFTFTSLTSAIVSEMNRAKAAVSSAVATMRSTMNFSWSLPHLKVPHINVSGSFSIDPPTAPKFSVSWYKNGGILDGAQIFGAAGNTLLGGGEAGKEAVLPLSDLWSEMRSIMTDVMTNTDTSRMSVLADRLDASMAGAGSGSISDLAGLFGDDKDSGGGEPGGSEPIYQITYSPTFQFYGEAPSTEDMTEATRMSQDEFNDMMDKWVKENSRKAF